MLNFTKIRTHIVYQENGGKIIADLYCKAFTQDYYIYVNFEDCEGVHLVSVEVEENALEAWEGIVK